MGRATLYHVEEGRCYILVEEENLGLEKRNLKLAISLARESVAAIEARMERLDDDSDEYDALQDEKNDREMLIAGFQDRLDVLDRRPL
jgi:hypothetical protein